MFLVNFMAPIVLIAFVPDNPNLTSVRLERAGLFLLSSTLPAPLSNHRLFASRSEAHPP